MQLSTWLISKTQYKIKVHKDVFSIYHTNRLQIMTESN